MGIKTLLLVEPSTQMRRLIRALLSSQVGQIVECTEGSEALAAYANSRPDWVLMDITTSASDGIAATRRIKELFADARITIMADYDDPAIRDAAFRAGASGFVVKEDLLSLQTVLADHACEKGTSGEA